jgi:RNA polymerase sigma factor (sigma-70 family)
MPLSDDSKTRLSLLLLLRQDPQDQSAWAAFVAQYGPQIHAWCRQRGLQEADAEDVTQMVLVRVARTLPGFVYDPGGSFRAWLRTLTRNVSTDLLADRVRAGITGDAVDRLLRSTEAWDELTTRLQRAHNLELLERAMEVVRTRVEAHTWKAFQLTALEHFSAAEVATRLGIGVGVVYRARSVVQGMLRDEVRALDPEADVS